MRWLRNARVSRKLAVVIAVHLLHASILFGVTAVGLHALSASRAYVEAEGLWSKAEKEATLQLIQYAQSGDVAHYIAYQAEVNVTLGDRQARVELERSSPDMNVVRSGFLLGRNDPADVDKMAWLFRTARNEPHIDEAIGIWERGDQGVDLLMAKADELYQERSSAQPDITRIDLLVDDIIEIDSALTVLEQAFSSTLGEGARWLTGVVITATIGLTVVFVGAAVLVSSALTRQLTRSLHELEAGATRVAAGKLGSRVEVLGEDEVGRVAHAFNMMSERLASALSESASLANERREALGIVERAAARLAEAQKLAHIGSWEWDMGTNTVTWSDELFRLYGLHPQEFEATYEAVIERIHPAEREIMNAAVASAAQTHESFQFDHRIVQPDGTVRWLHAQGAVEVDSSGKPFRMHGTGEDITERKLAEENVRASLAEKEALLKEIHHRVKNNLQVTSGLLLLQSKQAKDEATRALFVESMGRIKSMALVHEKLYASKSLASINFSEYVEDLLRDLLMSYGAAERHVSVKTDLIQVALDVDTSVSLGLILNELVSNALKHAFPGGRAGRISVTLAAHGPNQIRLSVRDDGVGLPSDFMIERATTMGLQLVAGLAKQVNGTLSSHSSLGTEFGVTFAAPQRAQPRSITEPSGG